MPRRTDAPPASEPVNESSTTALAMPADVRADLLRAQAAAITTPQALPRLKVLGQGIGMFEYTDTNETVREVRGVILNAFPSNVLWDKKYGVDAATELEALPACVANDGVTGVPREGFAHLGLARNRELWTPTAQGGRGMTIFAAQAEANRTGQKGDRVATVECATCPYNKWGSAPVLIPDKKPKGKAVTNQRRIYIMVEGREMPMELVLPPTSLGAYDAYTSGLLNRGIPVQAVVTLFAQQVVGPPNNRYAEVTFRTVETLPQEGFEAVIERRQRHWASITPRVNETAIGGDEPEPTQTPQGTPITDDDAPPF